MTNPISDIYQRMWKPEYPRLEILPPQQPSTDAPASAFS
jgi:hypothetical protein